MEAPSKEGANMELLIEQVASLSEQVASLNEIIKMMQEENNRANAENRALAKKNEDLTQKLLEMASPSPKPNQKRKKLTVPYTPATPKTPSETIPLSNQYEILRMEDDDDETESLVQMDTGIQEADPAAAKPQRPTNEPTRAPISQKAERQANPPNAFPPLVEKKKTWTPVQLTPQEAPTGKNVFVKTTNNEVSGAIRAPPIIIEGHVTAALSGMLRNGSAQFTIEAKRRSSVIKPKDIDTHKKIMETIEANNINAYTYSTGVNSTTMRMIRGLHSSFQATDIEEEILAATGIKSSVTPMSITKEGLMKKLDLFKVKTDSPEDMMKIEAIYSLFNTRIQFEVPHKRDVTQCFRCQRFGHVATNCRMTPICVKCDKSHEMGQCSRTPNAASPPYCANCLKFGHPASFKGCPRRIEVIESMDSTRRAKEALAAERRKNLIESEGRPVVPGTSYAERVRVMAAEINREKALKKAQSNQPNRTKGQFSDSPIPPSPTHQPNHALNQTPPFFENASSLCTEINNQLPQFKQCKSKIEQQTFITLFLFNYLANNQSQCA